MLNKMFEKMRELGWEFHDPEIEEGIEEDIEIEIENWSPEGENLVTTICFDGTPKGLVNALEEHYDSFDIDEHVELWIASRGKNGVPNSIRDLVKDAEDIEKMYLGLYEVINSIYKEGEQE